MGNGFQTIADVEVPEAEAEALGLRIRDWLVEAEIIEPVLRDNVLGNGGMGYPPHNYEPVTQITHPSELELRQLWTNGLQISIGRTVFHTITWEVTVSCPNCGERSGEVWWDAISAWHEATGADMLLCPHCGQSRSVSQWIFNPPWGFGYLGFTFWNWPPLKPDFIEEFKERLGHRTVFIADKL